MKVTVDKGVLAKALTDAGRAISTRNTLPALSFILLETQEGQLKLTATDMDTAIHATAPATVWEEGTIGVPAGVFADIIGKLPDGLVSLEMNSQTFQVRHGKSDYEMHVLPADDFPVIPEVTDGIDIVLPQAVLKTAIRQIAFAASKEETRSILMGLLFEAKANGKSLTIVGTDTHRMACKTIPLKESVPTSIATIVPARPLMEMERMLRETVEENVLLRIASSHVMLQVESTTLISRVLDGQYPNYEKVFPKNPERTMKFRRDEMLNSLRRVFIVAKQNSEKGIFTTKGDVLELTAQSQDIGRAYEQVPIEMDGGDITIAFNIRYLIDLLSILEHEHLSLEMCGALNPGVIRIPSHPEYRYVVMPMQS